MEQERNEILDELLGQYGVVRILFSMSELCHKRYNNNIGNIIYDAMEKVETEIEEAYKRRKDGT